MTSVTRAPLFFVAVFFVGTLLLLFVPNRTDALGLDADKMCNPVILQCGCGQIMGPKGCIGGPNMWKCPCYDTTNTFGSSGICVAPMKCLAQSTGGPDGFGLDIVKSMLGELMKKLMQQGSGGGSGGGWHRHRYRRHNRSDRLRLIRRDIRRHTSFHVQHRRSLLLLSVIGLDLLGGNDTTNGNGLSLSDQLNALTDSNANTLTNNNANTSSTLNRQLNERAATSTSTTTRTL